MNNKGARGSPRNSGKDGPNEQKPLSIFGRMKATAVSKVSDRKQPQPRRTHKEALDDGTKQDLDIFHAAQTGSVNLLKQVLSTGQPIDSLDVSHRTPLHLATQGSHKEMVEFMLKSGASARVKTKNNGLTPLHEVENGEVAELLIQGKADINAQDEWGMSPLHHASNNGFAEVVRCLTHYKAMLNPIDGMGRTPLHLAAQHGYIDIVEELASSGADLTVKDRHHRTALDAAKTFGQTEVAEVLLQMDGLLGEMGGGKSLRNLPAGSPARLNRGVNNSLVERPRTADKIAQQDGSDDAKQEQATGEINRLTLE
eukprot:CAMPEP_0181294042 /NCGR_PEP_ID=MMETSP1101-20121128/3385_1 /TAXON_ID=46948 /ORGANISM="Rhodomonas abbreviata, Strain Caron Lab Isolate" /LENGTH=311 /DNA_ID=CAMNT_0023398665 /DNA_START=112 /DNA_END=1047 /DNA_ORIENTATION=-